MVFIILLFYSFNVFTGYKLLHYQTTVMYVWTWTFKFCTEDLCWKNSLTNFTAKMKQKLKYENVYTDSENDDDDVKNTNSKKL